MILVSCSEDSDLGGYDEVSLSIKGTRATIEGDLEDYEVITFRILAFERDGDRKCVSNKRYDTGAGFYEEAINHAIKAGTYDFMFLANEPSDFKGTFDLITKYDDLNSINLPYSAFGSNKSIPMIRTKDNITVQSNYNLNIDLDRLAMRIDVLLQAKQNLEDVFTGMTLDNIAGKVPLMGNYLTDFGTSQSLSVTKDKFTTITDFTPEQAAEGIVWAKKYSRIILPSKNFIDPTNEEKAMLMRVHLTGEADASCLLKIASDPNNYTLPANSFLDVTASILDTRTLELNVRVADWESNGGEWNVPSNRLFNISETEVSITDFNGARLFFWSDMPIVRVMPFVKQYDEAGNLISTLKTNDVFNVLSAYKSWIDGLGKWQATERFSHDPTTGHGYMDIMVDKSSTRGVFYYELTVVASENEFTNGDDMTNQDLGGVNRIYRTIRVRVQQEGERYDFNDEYSYNYVGAFFRNNETGERVISGVQHSYYFEWTATTTDDFIVLSSSPSLDPKIGTEQPGLPEDYPVIPNSQKNEDGKRVTGAGCVYFRIGLNSVNPDPTKPRYGTVKLSVHNKSVTIYVRQGESPDYLMRTKEEGGAAFSPYNLIVKSMKDRPNQYIESVIVGQPASQDVVFVEYPTQGGSHFQWATHVIDQVPIRIGYHPMAPTVYTWYTTPINEYPFWNPTTGTKYKDQFEYCPTGYHRPSDGPVDQIAVNSFAKEDQVKQSEWRMSLFKSPMAGDGTEETRKDGGTALDGNDTEFYEPKVLGELLTGFYADGFFDRRPIQQRRVSPYNSNVAYFGSLFFNSETNASLFLPSAGRRANLNGNMQYAAETGYYWSSSTAPGYASGSSSIVNQVRGFEFGYSTTKPMGIQHTFGNSMRCVRD